MGLPLRRLRSATLLRRIFLPNGTGYTLVAPAGRSPDPPSTPDGREPLTGPLDPLLPLVCLATGSAIPLTALALLVRRGMRQLHVARSYIEVARRLGLSADTRGLSLQGHMNERRLWIGEVMVGHGPQRQLVTRGVVDLLRPLGLGITIRRRGLSERLFRRGRAPVIQPEDPELARVLETRGDDHERVRALLTSEVRAALHELMAHWPDVVITDDSVRVHLRQPESSSHRLESLVDAMLRLCEALEEARRAVPPPDRLVGLAPAWRPMRERLGLELEPWLPAATGEPDGRRLVLAPRREAHGYEAELRLFFRPHDETGLRVRPHTDTEDHWSVGQDIGTGDPRFDAAYVVKGWDPERIRSMMSDEVRRSLLTLNERAQVEIDDHVLRVRRLPLEPEALEPLVIEALELASALGW